MSTEVEGSTERPPWRVVLADDDASFRRLVRMLFDDDPEFTVVGEAANGEEAVLMAEATQPDCVILDMKMPVMDGDVALALIKEACPNTDVIALSGLEWAPKVGPAPDAALEKGRESWMELLLPLVATLATSRQVEAA